MKRRRELSWYLDRIKANPGITFGEARARWRHFVPALEELCRFQLVTLTRTRAHGTFRIWPVGHPTSPDQVSRSNMRKGLDDGVSRWQSPKRRRQS